MDDQGVLYGTTYYGGASNHGTVFSLTPPSSPGGSWTEAVLYNFTDGYNSSDPGGVLVGKGPAGQPVLYGTAKGGASGDFVFYSLTAPSETGAPWTYAALYSFPMDYRFTPGPLVWGPGGVLYGVTSSGGGQHWGSVFALLPPKSSGSSWTFRNLYSFDAGPDAANGNRPYWGEILAVGPEGLIYGTASEGGVANSGTVFTLQP